MSGVFVVGYFAQRCGVNKDSGIMESLQAESMLFGTAEQVVRGVCSQ